MPPLRMLNRERRKERTMLHARLWTWTFEGVNYDKLVL